MLPYSRGLILDNTHNYGIMKTEAVFGFGTPDQNNYGESYNASQPMEWIITNGSFQRRSLQEDEEPASTKPTFTVNIHTNSIKKSASNSQESKSSEKGKKRNKKKRQSKKINKCVIKFSKGGEDGENTRGKKRRRGNRIQKAQKKYMMPVILGLLAAKSLLIPIALKALAFMSAKGLMMGFFSTVLASVLSLKGMFSYPQEYHNRKDDSKTQVEIIQVPTKSEDHIYYDEHQYKRGDFVPLYPNMLVNGDHVVKKKATWNKG